MQTLNELLQSISAANMVDIAIMACLIYFVLLWFKDTRAFQILATLLAIGIFYFVASALGLILTTNFFKIDTVGLILVLISNR